MSLTHRPTTAEDWFRHLFGAKAARDGGVVRRKVRDMELMVGRVQFLAEVERRGFTAVENGDQVVVFCNAQPVRYLTSSKQRYCRQQILKEDLPPDFL